jgi:hypothetical protein
MKPGEADPEIVGFKAKRNARRDGEGGVCTLKEMRDARRKILAFMEGQPIPQKKECLAAMNKWFESEVPKTIDDFAGLPHKPVYQRLPPYNKEALASAETLPEEAIVLPGIDREGGIERVVGPHNDPKSVERALAERRRMRKDGGRDPTTSEEALKGKEFYDDGMQWKVLDVCWMDEDGNDNKAKEVIGYYYRKDCGVEEVDMYDNETGLPGDKSDGSVLQFSLIPEIEDWVARSVEYTPEQINQRKSRAEADDLGGLTVVLLKARFKGLGIDPKAAFPGRALSSLIEKRQAGRSHSAELERKQGEDDQLVVDASWSVDALRNKAQELGLTESNLVLEAPQAAMDRCGHQGALSELKFRSPHSPLDAWRAGAGRLCGCGCSLISNGL